MAGRNPETHRRHYGCLSSGLVSEPMSSPVWVVHGQLSKRFCAWAAELTTGRHWGEWCCTGPELGPVSEVGVSVRRSVAEPCCMHFGDSLEMV